ncbi:uncharacterized protein LOC131323554 [Rhododendron vialii]|uniref:uncharacterized protein LOC131323554 n=1 Tax=Rhododendron vialii TaxID=182163 RepID=UPI00265E2B99|nr:uncharacterized protein LOC131323554 [Rhododendron vialii]
MNRYLFSGILLVGVAILELIIGSGDDQREETHNRNSNRDNSSPERATNQNGNCNRDNSSPKRATNQNRNSNRDNSSPEGATNPATDKTSAQKSPYGLSSESSPKSHATSSKTLPPESKPPPPPVSSLSNSSPKKATYHETDKTSAQKSPYGLSSESSPKSQASSSKTLPSESKPPPPPVSSLSNSSPKKATYHETDKTSAQKSPYGLSSESSPKSQASSSKTLPSESKPPPPPVSSLSNSSPKKATYHETDKTSAQKSPYGLSSESSPKSQASSSKTLPSESKPPPPPVSSLSNSSPKKATYHETDKTSAQKSPYGLSSESSPKSQASSSKTLPSESKPPPPPVSSLSNSSPKKATYHETDKTSAQKSPYGLSSESSPKSHASSLKTLPSESRPPPPPVSSLSSSSFGIPLSSGKPGRLSTQPILSVAPSSPTNPNSKTTYICVGASPTYAIPEDLKDSIKNDVVPGILKRPLSSSTYKDYFEALLYAEDFYLEKWDGFEMKKVTLELEEASFYKRKGKYNKKNVDDEKDDKVFVAFELDSIPERRPFLLSRDFVSVSPSGTRAEPFQGLIYRVVKSNRVLVEFGEDFHVQHYPACKYNVKFSFNRVCLKRAHQAVATASDLLFRNFLFPDSIFKNSLLTAQLPSIDLDWHQISAVRHILSNQNTVPYLVEGPIAVDKFSLSRTGLVVCEAVLQVYRTSPSCRILICAPTNKGCDVITRSLIRGKIPESNIFRANAAFRELDGVPEDILPSCLYKKERECFSCPSIHELRKFKVISSTFMSSHRLHDEGIMAGHFSHIFLVDASSVIEPEAMVALANLANESTVVTVTGAPRNHSGWIHSDMARQNGLLVSYFERLRKSKLYDSLDSKVITVL